MNYLDINIHGESVGVEISGYTDEDDYGNQFWCTEVVHFLGNNCSSKVLDQLYLKDDSFAELVNEAVEEAIEEYGKQYELEQKLSYLSDWENFNRKIYG